MPFEAVGGALLGAGIDMLAQKGSNKHQNFMANKAKKYDREVRKDAYKRYKWSRDNERAYNEAQTEDDRRYQRKLVSEDRNLTARLLAEDEARYKDDRNFMQGRSDRYARATAKSRGVDWQRMRDDAVAAGYNPMTALSMANMYATDINYGAVGDVYSQGAAFQSPGSAGSFSPSSGTGSVGGYNSPGSGYVTPAGNGTLTNGAMIGAAFASDMGNFIQSFGADPEAEAVMAQVKRQRLAAQLAGNVRRNDGFGWDYNKIQPYQPDITFNPGGGPLSRPASSSGNMLPTAETLAYMYPDRDYSTEPVMDIPVFGMYDFGNGRKYPGLSQDVEWSEGAQMGNEAQLFFNWYGDDLSDRALQDWNSMKTTANTGIRFFTPPFSSGSNNFNEYERNDYRYGP